jgi:cytochrome P450
MLSEAFPAIHREDPHMTTEPAPTMSACPFHSRQDAAAPAMPPLLDPDLRMRPPGEPLPAPLREHGGPLAEVFARWLRQRDDAAHAPEKAALTRALLALSEDDIRAHARRQAAIAMQGGWAHWHWAVPAATVASLLGLVIEGVDAQRRLHLGLRAMAAGLGAQADGETVRAAGEAVAALLDGLDDAERRAPDAPLQWTLLRHAAPSRWTDRAAFTANRLGLIWQSHEAGAALLGHALLEMRSSGHVPAREDLLRLAREGGAVRLTRRFDRRQTPPLPVTVPLSGTDHPFGEGPHRCPGQGLALSSAHAALVWLGEQDGLRWPSPAEPLALPNMNIPQFQDQPDEESRP